MQDRQPGAPGQYKATVTAAELQKLQAGEQFTITMVRDDHPIVEGTPYSKAAVLPDALAAIICPETLNPTPADALSGLLPKNGKAAMEADLPMGGHKVTGLGTPAEDGDAVPLEFANGHFAPAVESAEYPGCYYRTVNGVVEWINPPMILGVEYRTTKRWIGKPVYTMAFGTGNLPNAASKSVATPIEIADHASEVISAIARTDSGSYLNIVDSANTGSIWIITESDYSMHTANLTVEYVK